MFTGLQARMEIVRMPLKKKDRDRLFEKDLEKGENITVAPFRTLMTDSIFTAPFYRISSMHTGSPAGSGF